MMQLILDKYNLPGYMFLLLFVYTLLFLYAPIKEESYTLLDEHSSLSYIYRIFISLLFLSVNSVAQYYMSMTEYDARNTNLLFLLSLCGLLWFFSSDTISLLKAESYYIILVPN